ncbi:phytoene/squalene synthase family protein [Baekduia sp. Peel2402]|uniref:phytoene/squalene synthase family protein n=1 Tax=Baekduia sp. Peel2402 TaxID=3458296 RepID=UPI00403ED164
MTDIELPDAYSRCAALQRRHDPTFHLATRALGRDVRPAVHALYGFLRGADELVDGPDRPPTPEARRAALDAWHRELTDGMASGTSEHPVIAAVVDAGRRHDLPLEELDAYMRSMGIDCSGHVRLRTTEELDTYMNGSAAAVGRVMAPLIGVPRAFREDVARLGVAFQLTNFLRDVREDFAMDRVYLPGLDEDALAAGRPTRLPVAEVRRAGELFRGSVHAVMRSCTPRARPGIALASGFYRRVHLGRLERRGAVVA